jgi:hypothetical protein
VASPPCYFPNPLVCLFFLYRKVLSMQITELMRLNSVLSSTYPVFPATGPHEGIYSLQGCGIAMVGIKCRGWCQMLLMQTTELVNWMLFWLWQSGVRGFQSSLLHFLLGPDFPLPPFSFRNCRILPERIFAELCKPLLVLYDKSSKMMEAGGIVYRGRGWGWINGQISGNHGD